MFRNGSGWLAFLLSGVGAGFLGLAGCSYVTSPPPGPAVHAEENVEVAEAVAGVKRSVALRLDNRSGRPVRVLGAASC